jgi:hypothetical protein
MFSARAGASRARTSRGETMKLRGILIASAALGLLGGGIATAAAAAEGGEVKCGGINGCAGKGECAAMDGSHGCAGKNSCKGKGWVSVSSAEECKKKGGTVIETDEE